MKVLLIGLKVGAGLESICFAVQNALGKHEDIETVYADIYAENEKMAKFSSENYYKWAKRFPRIMAFGQNVAYDIALNSKKKHTFINKDVCEMKKELAVLIERHEPDLIYTPLNTVSVAFDEMIDDGAEIKYVFQMPDFMIAYYSHQLKYAERIVASCDEVADILVEKGVDEDKILNIGVPIAEKFYQNTDKDKVLQDLKTDGKKFILMSNGGAGFANNYDITKYLYDKIEDYYLIVVNGRNQEGKEKIDEFIRENNVKNVINLGFVSNMHELMKISDIMIGKSGSSSVCEASTCGVKFIVLDNKLFPEVRNIKFLKKKNCAVVVKNKKQILDAIKLYISQDEDAEVKHTNFKELTSDNVAEKIATEIIDILKQ